MPQHRQVWVKVNAQVDEGIAEIIALLNTIPHLQTIDSCQGAENARAFIYFYLNGWKSVGHFLFEVLEPNLRPITGTEVSVEMFNGSDPMGKICFRAESEKEVCSALKTALATLHKFPCSCDTECTELHR